MSRILTLALLLSLVVVGCTAQPTATPTPLPPTPVPATNTSTIAPTNTPTDTPTPTPTAVPITGTVKANLNVRESPVLTAKSLGQLKKDDAVIVIARSNDNKWLQINYPTGQTSTGWALAQLIQTAVKIDSIPATTTVLTQETPTATTLAQITPTLAATKVITTNAPTTTTTTTVTTPKATATQVTTGGAAPSGSIIFDTFQNGKYQINRVRGDGTGLTTLLDGAEGSEPAVSPNGSLLAYHKRTGAGGVSLVIANLDGSNEKTIVKLSTAGYPTWSPDGNNIAYHLLGNNSIQDQIFWVPALPGSNSQQIGLGKRPAWQPGGSNTVIFDGCNGTGGSCFSLYTENAFAPDIKNPALVVHGTSPAWSPNGQQIAFVDSDAAGNLNIFVANRDGANKRQVTKDSGQNGLPVWSSDGQWLFYRSDQNGTSWAIYAIRADGSNARKVVDAPVNPNDWPYEKLAIAP